jgi:hypothetical protein
MVTQLYKYTKSFSLKGVIIVHKLYPNKVINSK